MSKIKRYAIDKLGEDEFETYLDDQMKGVNENGKRA